ncbi:hypothetical protein [Volucribacter psittacicida]|uniref:hypothetical protein n=1 Tax=Volucribacter psittacicida TaxID=203482 RepID=UPI001A9E7A4B|nr:hypothetical protein [Volucribacter psittacicida]
MLQYVQYYSSIIKDPQINSAQSVSLLISEATQQATVLAYNDLFSLIFYTASIAFLISLFLRFYRRYKGITLLGNELSTLAKMMKQ